MLSIHRMDGEAAGGAAGVRRTRRSAFVLFLLWVSFHPPFPAVFFSFVCTGYYCYYLSLFCESARLLFCLLAVEHVRSSTDRSGVLEEWWSDVFVVFMGMALVQFIGVQLREAN